MCVYSSSWKYPFGEKWRRPWLPSSWGRKQPLLLTSLWPPAPDDMSQGCASRNYAGKMISNTLIYFTLNLRTTLTSRLKNVKVLMAFNAQRRQKFFFCLECFYCFHLNYRWINQPSYFYCFETMGLFYSF